MTTRRSWRVVTEALRYEAYEVLDIAHSYQLWEAVTDFSPDLVLMDYRLADTNGGDLCLALKNEPASRHIPVVIFFAYFSPSDGNAPGGCDGILYKPFETDHRGTYPDPEVARAGPDFSGRSVR